MNQRFKSSFSLYFALHLDQLRTRLLKMRHRGTRLTGPPMNQLENDSEETKSGPVQGLGSLRNTLANSLYSVWKSSQRSWRLATEEDDRRDDRHSNPCFLQASSAKSISSCCGNTSVLFPQSHFYPFSFFLAVVTEAYSQHKTTVHSVFLSGT